MGALTDLAKANLLARYLTRKHKTTCKAKEVLPYDNRFNEVTKDPATGRLKLPDYIKDSDIGDLDPVRRQPSRA